MTVKPSQDPQFDLFVPYLSDLPLRDQRETMERPFFSLAKRKRLKPIDYVSPDGKIWVKVAGHQDYGMATIWDADILIWAASALMEMREKGVNDLPRTLQFHPYNLLKAIRRQTGRSAGGEHYERLRAALDRLTHTAINTNIRGLGKKNTASFHWLDKWTEQVDEASGDSRHMTLTLSDWLYEGIKQDGGVLAVDPDYFLLTGGLERWLYRIARKHAGNQSAGWACSISTLYEKSGAEDRQAKFKAALKRIVAENPLPEYYLTWQDDTRSGEPALYMVRRSHLSGDHPGHQWQRKRDKRMPSGTAY
jgi:plasmid replication initiation protein